MDENLKREFDSIVTELGMNMTTAFTVLAKADVREQGIPFILSADPFISATNLARLHESIAELNASRVAAHEPIEDSDETGGANES